VENSNASFAVIRGLTGMVDIITFLFNDPRKIPLVIRLIRVEIIANVPNSISLWGRVGRGAACREGEEKVKVCHLIECLHIPIFYKMASEDGGGVITPLQLEIACRERIPNTTHVHAEDLSDGCGGKFSLLVVSEEFKGKPLLAQQRLVNGVLKDEISRIHAITLKTKTPEQYAKMLATAEGVGGVESATAVAVAEKAKAADDHACMGHDHGHSHGHNEHAEH
jgi:stress-induced morphogen